MMNSDKFFEHSYPNRPDANTITASQNLSFYKGFGQSPNIRLFVFKEPQRAVSVNFVEQVVNGNCIVIVPPKQLHFLPEKCSDFICIEIPANGLISEDFIFIKRFFYNPHKHLDFDKIDGLDYDILKALLSFENSIPLLIKLFKSKIQNSCVDQFSRTNNSHQQYLKIASEFEIMIKGFHFFTLEHSIIARYANVLNCSEKTLYRACDEIFGVAPQEILKHHLLQSAIYLLIQEQLRLNCIADRLGYATVQGFSRFIKAATSLSPLQIRKKFLEANY